MAHPYHHALSSVKAFGGELGDHLRLHSWMDGTKAALAHLKHRSLRHSTFGRTLASLAFPDTRKRYEIVSQHIREDCNNMVPTPRDWFCQSPPYRTKSFQAHCTNLANRFHVAEENVAELVRWMLCCDTDYQEFARYQLLHSWGCFEAELQFGTVLNCPNKRVPTRLVAEKLIQFEFGIVPSVADALRPMIITGLDFAINGAEPLSRTLQTT